MQRSTAMFGKAVLAVFSLFIFGQVSANTVNPRVLLPWLTFNVSTTDTVNAPTNSTFGRVSTTDTVNAPTSSTFGRVSTTDTVNAPTSSTFGRVSTTDTVNAPTSSTFGRVSTTDTVNAPTSSTFGRVSTTDTVNAPTSSTFGRVSTTDTVNAPTSSTFGRVSTTDTVNAPTSSTFGRVSTTDTVNAPTSLTFRQVSATTVSPQTSSPPDPATDAPTPGTVNNINTLLLLLIAVSVVVLAIPILIVTLVYVCNKRSREVSLPMVELPNMQQAETTANEDRHKDMELFNKLCSDFSNLTGGNSPLPIQLQTNYSSTHFAGGVFDHNGGHLSVPRHDINLFIPPGAIEVGQLKIIHIFVPPSMNHGKPAPIVHCGPTGTTFRDHVILTFPVEQNHDEIVPKFTNTDEGSAEKWQPLLEDGDAAYIVKNGKCTLFISHFTGFGAEAKEDTSPKAVTKDEKKIIRVGAFASKHTPDDHLYQLRIRFYDASADASERMYHKEMSQFGGRLLDDDKRMQVDKCGVAVRMRVSRICAGWRTIDESDKNQSVEVAQLWDGSDETDTSCTVRLEKINPTAPMTGVWATVSVWQDESRGSTVTLKPSDALQMSPRGDYPPRGCLSPTQAFLHQQDELRPCDRPLPILPLDARHEMCVLLDVEMPGGKDWRMLAEKFEIDSPTIRWLGRNKSPTSKLLDFWETQNVSGGTVALQRLCDLYEEMERPDVKELTEKVLSSEGRGDSGYEDSDSQSTHGSLRSSLVNIQSDPFPEHYNMNAPLKTMTLLDV